LLKQAVKATSAEPDTNVELPIPRRPARRRGLGAWIVLAPTAAALIAISAHRYLPNGQGGPPTRLYPLLLQILLGASLTLAVAQWLGQPLRAWARHNAPLMAGAVMWLFLWDLVTLKLAWMPLPYFPGPDLVLNGIADDWKMLLDSAYHSLKLLLTGYTLGVALGLFSGVLMGWFRTCRYWGMPIMKVVGPIPAAAFIPTMLVLIPNLFFSGAALIALAVWFPVTMLTMSGIANVPKSYFDVARTLGAGRGYLIFRVAIPAAMPGIFLGLFVGLVASFLTLFVAETVGVKSGLGWYLIWRKGYAEYDKVYGDLVIMAAFFSTIMTLLFKLRDWLLSWQKGVLRW
jgi:NitT/TauT family transport system permease protein